MQYNSLKIQNFRGINDLEIEDFKRINLLVGRNNCGKTSILEALFLLSGMSNPRLLLSIHNFRDLILTEDEGFCYIFKNLNFEIPVIFKGILDHKNRELRITPLFVDYQLHQSNELQKKELSQQQDAFTVSTNPVRLVEGLELEFKNHSGKSFSGQISLKDKNVKLPADYKEDLKCAYLNPKTIMAQIDKMLEGLLVQKKLASVIEVLKVIEPEFVDIRMGAGGMIYVDIGADSLLPLNIMGDGMRRLLAILAAIADMRNGLLLIDEIENGFHYTSLNVLWKSIIAACKEYNVQLVATTHSYECIEALSNANNQSEPAADDIRLFRIDRNEGHHKAYKFTAQAISAGIEKDFEVR